MTYKGRANWVYFLLGFYDCIVKAVDVLRDIGQAVLDGEVAGGEGMQFSLWKVLQEGIPSGWGKENVALTPENDGAGLVLAEEGLPRRIKSDVVAIVVEEIQLEAFAVRALECVEVVGVPVVGTDEFRVG